MDMKPQISYAGDAGLFNSLEFGVVQGLPLDTVEWRRSYGRAPTTVYVDASFVPFHENLIRNPTDWKLIGQTFLHTFWTDCSDSDHYKSTLKDDISNWLQKLRNKNVQDWLIISVESLESRKVGKAKLLPRTTVLDKIKNDFCSRQPDRCVALLDPLKSDSRGAESWQVLLQRLRQLMLQAYNRQLVKFEEHMRSERERRNEQGWSFCQYFILQEELAFVFEMLGVYDEALVQYDELDALFSQFVLNSNVGDTPSWLHTFTRESTSWLGPRLARNTHVSQREPIVTSKASLLDLRNYLFARQCSLLLLLYRPWEMAQRTLPFVHNCINELKILDVAVPQGAVSCWVYLTCAEVLHTCERFSDSGQVEAYLRFTACLWAYAREKLQELGQLCGLMSELSETSEQLHLAVGLLAGMEEDEISDADNKIPSPVVKLREALSSKEAFQRHHLELSELSMGTFKHIGLVRSARFIGRDLAHFYMKLGEHQKAATFLSDALKTFRKEKWEHLMVQTYLEIAECYKAMQDHKKLITAQIHIAASPCLPEDVRHAHFQELASFAQRKSTDEILLLSADGIFEIENVELIGCSDTLIADSSLTVRLTICNKLLKAIECEKISLSQHLEGNTANREVFAKQKGAIHSILDTGSTIGPRTKPRLGEMFKYQEDRSLESAHLVCSNEHQCLRRRDSSTLPEEHEDLKEDFSLAISKEHVTLNPGQNEILLETKVGRSGVYRISQLSIQLKNIELLSRRNQVLATYKVVHEPFGVFLHPPNKDSLLAGIEQEVHLSVTTGSNTIEDGTVVRLTAFRGLLLKYAPTNCEEEIPVFMQSVECLLPASGPFSNVFVPVKVLCELGSCKEVSSLERKVFVTCPWVVNKMEISIHFVQPFSVSHKLHTAVARKFIEVVVQGIQPETFRLRNPVLSVIGERNLKSTLLNPSEQILEIAKKQCARFMWQIGDLAELTEPIKFDFGVDYGSKCDSDDGHQLRRVFVVSDYTTLYTVRSKVEPKGSEFCRVGNMCNLHIHISKMSPGDMTCLMYEVLADQTSWAVCGQTAGVVSIESNGNYDVTLDVMPLSRGFLALPLVRLSKYIAADHKAESPKKADLSSSSNYPRVQPFGQGQIYNWSKAIQVHVLPAQGSTFHAEAVLQ